MVVTLVMPSRGLTVATLTDLAQELRESARTMSEQLGHAAHAQQGSGHPPRSPPPRSTMAT